MEKSMNKQPIIAFIGGGNMTFSLVSGLIESGYDPNHIWLSDHHEEKYKHFSAKFKISVDGDNLKVANQGDILVLAVKPKDMQALVLELKDIIKKRKPLIISVATGIQTAHFNQWLGSTTAIVRAMPNTPALLRVGATGLYASSQVSEEQKNLAESILRAVGIAVWVNHEHELDTIAALSGSGPAYFFLVMEALAQSAESLGLPKNIAHLLTMQTALGAARMALESEHDLAELRKKVASPGGITEKALNILESGDIRGLLKKAVQVARDRSIEISHQFDQK
jgi:pyrroline-5-carboxylate reductase